MLLCEIEGILRSAPMLPEMDWTNTWPTANVGVARCVNLLNKASSKFRFNYKSGDYC